MYGAASEHPQRGQKREYGADAHPSVHSGRSLQLKNWLTELSYHQNRTWRLAPSGLKSTRNVDDSAIRCTERLRHFLSETNNASTERTHTQVCFQVGLSS